MKPFYHYTTVSEALSNLKELGFTHDFNLHEAEIIANPNKYNIEHVYRYEGDTSPDDEAIVYGIVSDKGIKGVFVSGYSANSNTETTSILARLCIVNH